MLFVANRTKNVYAFGIYDSNYSIIEKDGQKSIQEINIVKKLQDADQYIQKSTEIVGFRVINYDVFEQDN